MEPSSQASAKANSRGLEVGVRELLLGLLHVGVELLEHLLGLLLLTEGLGDQGEGVLHVADRVLGVGAAGDQQRDVVLLQLLDQRGAALGLGDHQVGVGGEDRVHVGLAAGADVLGVRVQRHRGVPGVVALDVGDADRVDPEGQDVLDLLPLEHHDPLGGGIELDGRGRRRRSGRSGRRAAACVAAVRLRPWAGWCRRRW